MSARFRSFLLVAVLHLAASGPACSEPVMSGKGQVPNKDEPTRADATGDSLPPGIVTRLGSQPFHRRVGFLIFSPDNKILASVSGDADLRLWDVASGKELQHFLYPYINAKGVGIPAFSSDGKLIALGYCERSAQFEENNIVRVWQIATGQEKHSFENLPHTAFRIQFHPSGRYLAGLGDSSIQIWDLQEKKKIEALSDLKTATDFAYTPDGKSLIAFGQVPDSKGQRKSFWQWDATSGKELVHRELEVATGSFRDLLSPDGALFAWTAPKGESVRLLEAASGKERCRLEGKTEGIAITGFSADNRRLAGLDKDGTIRVWETGQGKLQHEFKGPVKTVQCLSLSSDGKLAAYAGRADNAIYLYDVTTGKELHPFPGHRSGPLTVAFAANGKSVFTANRDWNRGGPVTDWAEWSLRQWEAASGKELKVTTNKPGGEIHWTCFSDDGRLLATVAHDGTLRLWDTSSGKELRQWQVPSGPHEIDNKTYQEEAIERPAFASDGKTLIAASAGTVCRWDVDTGKALPVLNIPRGNGYSTARPGPDADTLLVFVCEKLPPAPTPVRLMDAASGRVLRTIGQADHPTSAHALSPDGRTLAVTERDRDAQAEHYGVALWEVASGRQRGWLKDTNGATALAFSPDGKLLAVGGDGVVYLALSASGRELARIDAYQGRVESLVFSLDGKWLAIAGDDNSALVCDVAKLTAGRIPGAAKLTAKELDDLWTDLSGGDGTKAYAAITRLAAGGKESVAYLSPRFKPAPPPDEKRIAQLITDLDNESFDVREKATAALGRLGQQAEPTLTRALEKTESTEVRTRIGRLLEKLKDPVAPPSPELVQLRMLEVLTNSETEEAHDLLKELAKGSPETQLTRAAKAALKGWEKRQPRVP
jgi:WD40 repeat protein